MSKYSLEHPVLKNNTLNSCSPDAKDQFHAHTKPYLLTYLLTPWSRVLLDKLTGLQLVKKFPAFMEPEGSLPHL
jgi:hypothetical protein